MKLLTACLVACLLSGSGAAAADVRRTLQGMPDYQPVSEFPNAYMASWKDAVASESPHGASYILKDAAMAGLGAAGLAAAKIVIEPCSTTGLHLHKRANEVVFHVSGLQEYTAFIDGQKLTRQLVPGDVAVAPAGNLHYGENNGCETETHLVFWDSLNTTRYVPATELFYFPDAVVGATFGVEDVPAFRDMFEIAAIDMAFAFAPLSVDSECVARCAKLEASGKQQKIPPSPPADKHSASLAGAEPHADNKYGTSRTITASELPALKEMAGNGATLTLETLQPCSVQVPHMHPNANEITYILEGEAGLNIVASETATVYRREGLGSDDVTLAPQASLHGFWNSGCKTLRLLSVHSAAAPQTIYPATELLQLRYDEVAAMMVYNGTQDELEGTITDPAKPPTAGFVADAQCQARCKAAS